MILAPPLASSILIFKDNLNARKKSQIWGEEAFGPICNLNKCHCVTGRKHLISDPDLLSVKLKAIFMHLTFCLVITVTF